MNTKTMRLPPRRVATATATTTTTTTTSSSNKRKEREASDPVKPSPPQPPQKLSKPNSHRLGSDSKPMEPAPRNQLLAGYLAHEFLTKGTLFGQRFDPARSEEVAVSAGAKKSGPSQRAEAEPSGESHLRYVDVSRLLKADGAHLPGIVNPTMLARFLQM